jgi:hypothetical protein
MHYGCQLIEILGLVAQSKCRFTHASENITEHGHMGQFPYEFSTVSTISVIFPCHA